MKLEQSELLFVKTLAKKSIENGRIPEETIVKVIPLTGDASTRRYYRIFTQSKRSYVVCLDAPLKVGEKNEFVEIQSIFSQKGVRVPTILDFEQEKGYLLEEDLGDRTFLHQLALAPDQKTEYQLYKRALKELINIHSINSEGHKIINERSFNHEKLGQEIQMTHEFFVAKYLNAAFSETEQQVVEKELAWMLDKITSLPMIVCHRDYHSRNIMIKDNDLVIIDFQDARLGLPQYDLVSLLEDCYYGVSRSTKYELQKEYYELAIRKNDWGQNSYEEFIYYYNLMAIQRIYKAIGSFSYIYSLRKDNRYLKYVGFSFENLRSHCKKIPELAGFTKIICEKYYAS